MAFEEYIEQNETPTHLIPDSFLPDEDGIVQLSQDQFNTLSSKDLEVSLKGDPRIKGVQLGNIANFMTINDLVAQKKQLEEQSKPANQ